MAKAKAGRIPYATDRYNRLHTVSIQQANDRPRFERMIQQLICGMLKGVSGGKVRWSDVPVGPGAGASLVQPDWVTWLPEVYEHGSTRAAAYLDFEATTHNLEAAPEYAAEKILQLCRLSDMAGGLKGRIDHLTTEPEFAGQVPLPTEPLAFLIFVSNRSNRLPRPDALKPYLTGARGEIGGSHPSISIAEVGPERQGLEVSTRAGKKIRVGLVGSETLLELVSLAQALHRAKRHDLVNERFLCELSSLACLPLTLSPMPNYLDLEGLTVGADLRIDGKQVTLHRFTVSPFQFLRMATVFRLVSDYSYLQRLPEGGRLEIMGEVIQSRDRFPTPILCIPAPGEIVVEKTKVIRQKAGGALTPYGWHIIDGQHRLFCYYFVEPGAGVQSIDVNSYTLAKAAEKADVASALFLDVNFKAERPSEDLGLGYFAYCDSWPHGFWIEKKGRKNAKDSDKDFYSSRVLASRFLLELSAQDTVYTGLFKSRGAKDPGKVSIKSLSTYLEGDFELRDPNDLDSLLAVKVGLVDGARGIWRTVDAAPEQLIDLWSWLVDGFDEYSTTVANGIGKGPAVSQGILLDLIRRNNNVFVGLWKSYVEYALRRSPGSTVKSIKEKDAARLARWLVREDSLGHFVGKTNRHKSGTGARTLPEALIKLLPK